MNTSFRPDVAALGRIVTVWAHPDDETYLAGGLMAMARCLGQPVTCITATPGDFAPTEAGRAAIAATRTAELAAALAELRVHDHVALGLRDGACAALPDEVGAGPIAAVLRDRRPDTVVTFGPDGFTGHPDHRAVSRWTSLAVARACPRARLLFAATTAAEVEASRDITDRFPVFEPGTPTVDAAEDIAVGLRLGGRWLDRKLAALAAHASQTTELARALGVARYRQWNAVEQFVDAPPPALQAAA
jgi:LmbE family N-acetylglucosaminyl deacetylase